MQKKHLWESPMRHPGTPHIKIQRMYSLAAYLLTSLKVTSLLFLLSMGRLLISILLEIKVQESLKDSLLLLMRIKGVQFSLWITITVHNFRVGKSELIMFPTIKRNNNKKRMKTRRGERGRSEGSAALSRGVNGIAVLHANSLMMRRELQTQAGVPRKIEARDGHMIRLTILGRIGDLANGVGFHVLITGKRSKSLINIQEILKQKSVIWKGIMIREMSRSTGRSSRKREVITKKMSWREDLGGMMTYKTRGKLLRENL